MCEDMPPRVAQEAAQVALQALVKVFSSLLLLGLEL